MISSVSVPGGSAKEDPHVRGASELESYEDLRNVFKVLDLRGLICCVLCKSPAPGGSVVIKL